MGKPKRFKKCLSFFLAFLMLLSSITVGFTAFAQPSDWEAAVKAQSNNGTNIGNWLYDIALAIYNDGNKNYTKGHPLSTDTYQNLRNNVYPLLTNLGSNTRGSYVEDIYEDGRLYKAIQGVWHITLETGNRDRNAAQVARRDTMGYLGTYSTSSSAGNLMGSDFPGEDITGNAIRGMIGAWHNDSTSRNSHHYTIVKLNESYALWNQFGNDLNSTSALITTVASFKYKTRGFVLGGANGAAEQMSEGYNWIDKIAEAIVVNADELKAFNNLVSSSTDSQRDYWNLLVAGAKDESKYDEIPRDNQIAIISQAKTLLNNIQNNTHSQNYTRTLFTSNNKPIEESIATSSADSRAQTQKIFEHYFGCTYSQASGYVDSLIQYLVKQYKEAVAEVIAGLYKDGNIANGAKTDLSLEALRDIKSNIDYADGIYNNLPSALKSEVTTEYNQLTNSCKPDYVKTWNVTLANAYVAEVEKLEAAYEGYPATFGNEGYIALIDTGLRPAYVKQTLDQANTYYNDFLKDYNTKTTATNATGITGTHYVNSINTAKGHYDYVLEKYNRYLYDDYLKAAHRLDAYWQKDSGSSYGSAYGGISARTDLNYFQIARAKSIIRTVNEKYNLLTSYYKTYGTNPGTSATPQNPPNYPPFYQNGVIPALNWAISQMPSEYQQYPIAAPTEMNWSNANSIKPITDLMNRISAFVSDDEMTKSLLGVSLNRESLDKALFTKGEPLNKTINDLCSTILIALGPILQKALFDTKITGAAAWAVGADDGLKAYRAGKITGLIADPKDYNNNTWFKNNWPEISALCVQANLSWETLQLHKDEMDWHITSVDKLADALGGATCGAEIIVDAVLQNREAAVKALNLVNQHVTDGTPGYEKLVLPILEFLGCENLRPVSNFNDDKFQCKCPKCGFVFDIDEEQKV